MFVWLDYLRLARELATRTDDEAALRSAISRAYYAAYCLAATFVLEQGLHQSESDLNHERVWRTFQIRADTQRYMIFNDGMFMKSCRTQADYWLSMRDHALPVQVRDVIARAERVIRNLDELRPREQTDIEAPNGKDSR